MHLAEELMAHLAKVQPELQITPREAWLVKTAGLCHDLGHGPFSHVFDSEFIPQARPGIEWHHEKASVMMLNSLLDRIDIDIDKNERQFLQELINPYDGNNQSNKKLFLYDIVANARNSVDVDKWDYIARDCHNIGFATNLKHDRLIKNARVINNEVCFNSKEVYNM